jgi:hypothetical protein
MCSGLGECGLRTQYGDLGIPNLQLMGFVLRLRWLWLDRVDSDKTWSGYFFRADMSAQAFFDASVTVQVGDGSRALFWMDSVPSSLGLPTELPHV